MVTEPATALTLADLLTAIGKAIASYISEGSKKTKAQREAVIDALNQIESTLARTEVYWQLRMDDQRNLTIEMDIATRWTDLGALLEELGMPGIARQCSVKGWYYRNSQKYNEEFWHDSRIEFSDISRYIRDAKTQLKAYPRQSKPVPRKLPRSEA